MGEMLDRAQTELLELSQRTGLRQWNGRGHNKRTSALPTERKIKPSPKGSAPTVQQSHKLYPWTVGCRYSFGGVQDCGPAKTAAVPNMPYPGAWEATKDL